MATKPKTIESTIRDRLCTGCGTCVGICPIDALEMVIDHRKGGYVPKLDKEKCTECGLCFEACPGHSVDFKQLNQEIFGTELRDILSGNYLLGNYLNCYIGHATDYDIRYNSASGGLVTALLIYALEKGLIDGALVTKMRQDRPLEPFPFIARTREDIIAASKSKYCPVPANTALKEILNAREGEKFAVVGLPCHIQGIRKAEQANKKLRDRIIHIGIFCGRTCSFLGTEFLLKRLGFSKEEVKHLDYRGGGWPGGMSIQLKNNEKIFVPLSHYWDDKFTSFILPRCVLCRDGTAELADISFGDAWGLLDDETGKSLIISRSKAGENILQRMLLEKNVEMTQIDAAKAVQTGLAQKKIVEPRFQVFKLLGRKLPAYNQELIKPKLFAYLDALSLVLRMFLSSKRILWGLLDIYVRIYAQLLKYASWIKRRLRL